MMATATGAKAPWRLFLLIVLLVFYTSSSIDSAGQRRSVSLPSVTDNIDRRNRTSDLSAPLTDAVRESPRGDRIEKAWSSNHDADHPKKVKRRRSSTAKPTTSSGSINGDTASIRRIRSEWKHAVQAGIAYHWSRGRVIRGREESPTSPSYVWIGPLDDRNLYVWHFTIVGLPGSPFDGGLYHGRVVLPRSYPLQPPRVQVWTESGRFVPRMDICLSASAYHPETWSPTHWTIRTLVESLRLHMATSALEVGSMNAPYEQRVTLAAASRKWKIRVPLSSGKLVTIDHDKMIRQGLFDGLLDVHDNEGLAVKSSKRVTVKRIEDSESLEEGSTMRKAEAKKRKQNRGSRRDGRPVLTGSNSVSSARHTAVQPVKDPLGVRILVAGLRLIPWLVAAWLWRVVLAWVLPA